MAVPQKMGIGLLGNAKIIFKRKFRWTFEIKGICGGKTIPPNFVKLASRPNLSIEETEINYLNAKTFIPGKGTWEPITVTYYDVAATIGGDGVSDPINILNWIVSVYGFYNRQEDPDRLYMGPFREAYAGTAILVMYDGSGEPLEEWTLGDVWPTSVNFGDLDFASSDTADIELTLRYSQVQYKRLCPGGQLEPCERRCTPGGATFTNSAFA